MSAQSQASELIEGRRLSETVQTWATVRLQVGSLGSRLVWPFLTLGQKQVQFLLVPKRAGPQVRQRFLDCYTRPR